MVERSLLGLSVTSDVLLSVLDFSAVLPRSLTSKALFRRFNYTSTESDTSRVLGGVVLPLDPIM